jgi:hypothetical protein
MEKKDSLRHFHNYVLALDTDRIGLEWRNLIQGITVRELHDLSGSHVEGGPMHVAPDRAALEAPCEERVIQVAADRLRCVELAINIRYQYPGFGGFDALLSSWRDFRDFSDPYFWQRISPINYR